MKFTIPCHVYSRLVNGALPVGSLAAEGHSRPGLSSILLERVKGKAVAVATNGGILACDYLGIDGEADGRCAITIDPILVTLALAAPDAVITVTPAPEWTFIEVEGVALYPGNGGVAMAPEWDRWRELIPTEFPKKPLGALAFSCEHLSLMGKVAPSGWVVLPKTYDGSMPVLCSDVLDPDWFGLFLPISDKKAQKTVTSAEIPEWIK